MKPNHSICVLILLACYLDVTAQGQQRNALLPHSAGPAKLTIKAIHEDRSPVPDAQVGVGFNQTQNYWKEGHKFDTKEFITDTTGTVIASGETTTGWITYGATKNGYYRTSGERLILDRKG
ncbi:MAG TPA: hypothetical protein VIT21_10145, partial [Chthoniobacterales bacterium]